MNRLTELFLNAPGGYFTPADIVTALTGSNHSRYGLVKRALAHGEIMVIRRGLYCLAAKYLKTPVSTFVAAQHILGPSYVSFETALSYHGWIPEAVHACVNTCLAHSREFDTPLGLFVYKRVPQKILLTGVERRTDADGNVFFMAGPVKALADLVHINRAKWRSIDQAAESLRIEPEQLMAADIEEVDTVADNCTNGRVRVFMNAWKKALKP
ncbi:MAG: type IV toxin-antitoxin system AbiEi family antitoxin domain-containing protein [Planctomycetota bacterium]